MEDTTMTNATTKTPRQVQDFRNGYSLGYYEARHGETTVEGKPQSAEHAAGIAAGLRDGRTATSPQRPGRTSAADLEAAVAAFIADSL